ncbi:hypothetical protein [Natronorubrum sp. DTA28]|uniref:hypothetical protein n=1 Tax=Natronorubrum sp. DTA28 TaxID=3447019 RepID=UPI003F85A946
MSDVSVENTLSRFEVDDEGAKRPKSAWFKSTSRYTFAARTFSSTVLGDAVALTDETVRSCCRSYAVLALECADCEALAIECDSREDGGI